MTDLHSCFFIPLVTKCPDERSCGIKPDGCCPVPSFMNCLCQSFGSQVIGWQEMKLAFNVCGICSSCIRAYEEYGGVYAPFRMSLMVRHGAIIISVISISMHG
jgi:hypothetical protein